MNVKVVETATGIQRGRILPAATDDVFAGIPAATIGAVRGIDSLFGGERITDTGRWGGIIGTMSMALQPASVPPWATMIAPLSLPVPYTPAVNATTWEKRARNTVGEVVPPTPLYDKVRAVYTSPNHLIISCTADITITGPTLPLGAPAATNPGGEPVIQTLHVNSPPFQAPIPSLTPVPRTTVQLMVNGLTTGGGDENFDALGNQIGQNGINNVNVNPYRYLVDPNTKLAGTRLKGGNTRVFANRNLDFTERDVVRTVALTGNATGVVTPGVKPGMQGDVRIIAAKKDVPANYFQISDPDFYDNRNVYVGQNSMRVPSDNMFYNMSGSSKWQYFGERNGVWGALVAGGYGANLGPTEFKAVNFYPSQSPPKYYRIDPTRGFAQSAIPSTERRSDGITYLIDGVKNFDQQAGDWDTGPFWMASGPLCNKPDEGTSPTRAYTPYLGDGGNLITQNLFLESQTFFSPNRLVPSPVMFGSLPTGVMRDRPWQTLLFRPAKSYFPGGAAHPGSAAAGPPDHLLLDLFWMPVVEPYAISEPFATAGKINLNQQIAPFINIHRDTGLWAVMKSVKIPTLNPLST